MKNVRKMQYQEHHIGACTKKNGLTSLIIGSLRDLRVNYYKSLSKKENITDEQKQLYTQ